MTNEQFLQQFGHFIDAPNGIQKLREMVLQLAVQGKLVQQDSNDDTSDYLMARIAEGISKLESSGKIKKQKSSLAISQDDFPYDIPESWSWQRLSSLCILENGDRSKNYPNKSALVETGIPFINAGHLENGRVQDREMNHIPQERFDLLRSGKVRCNDILYCLRGSLGKVGLVTDIEKGAIASSLVIVRLFTPLVSRYFLIYFGCPLSQAMIKKYDNGTAQPNLSATDLGKFLIPLPPLAEQHRIVAKVDELMALCDQLETERNAREATHQRLIRAVHHPLTEAGDTNTTSGIDSLAAWHRIRDNFADLYTTLESVQALRQTILQLTVQGKLVPQDDGHSVATEILEEISKDKSKFVLDNNIKRLKDYPPINEKEEPFALPKGWAWARIGDVLNLKHGFAFKSKYFTESETAYVLTTPGNFYERGGFRDRGNRTKYYTETVESEFILHPGDLIIPMTEQAPGLLGSPAFIPDDGKTYIHNQRLGKLTLYSTKISPEFVYWFFNSPYLRNELANSCSGTTVRHTSPDKVLKVLYPICPTEEQHHIVAKVGELMSLCDQLEANIRDKNDTATRYADAIVQQIAAA